MSRMAWIIAGIAGITCLVLFLTRGPETIPETSGPARRDREMVHGLLRENLSTRRFSFPEIVEASSGKKVLPLDDSATHHQVVDAIESALEATIRILNLPDSPVRKLHRINEASRFFEDGLMQRINAMDGLRCDLPPTHAGHRQRSGYPDLRITDEASGAVFYLDPKLIRQGTETSTFRSFYFEPKDETLKITEDAVHLLLGIEHDGNNREWTFLGWRLVDLSTLSARLKAEFQASNADLYRETKLSLPETSH